MLIVGIGESLGCDLELWNDAIRNFASMNDWTGAMIIFGELLETYQLIPSNDTYVALMKAFGEQSIGDDVIPSYHQSNTQSNQSITQFNSCLLLSIGGAGNVAPALSVLDQMLNQGPVEEIIYSSLITVILSTLAHSGLVVLKILSPSSGHSPHAKLLIQLELYKLSITCERKRYQYPYSLSVVIGHCH